jgi:hypothetical protein
MKIYKGYIVPIDYHKKYLPAIDFSVKHSFIPCGTLIGLYEILTYQLCDKDGEPLPEYENIQFSRDRHNRFFLECND